MVLRILAQGREQKTLKEIAEETALPESRCSQIVQVGLPVSTIFCYLLTWGGKNFCTLDLLRKRGKGAEAVYCSQLIPKKLRGKRIHIPTRTVVRVSCCVQPNYGPREQEKLVTVVLFTFAPLLPQSHTNRLPFI